MYLYTGFGKYTRADYAVLPYLLSDSCAQYPDLARFHMRLSELYGMSVVSGTSLAGGSREVKLACSAIDDRYALEGEALTRDGVSILLGCLLEPVTEGGVFKEDMTRVMKGELIDAIDSAINEKRSYAAQRGASFAYEGEPAGADIQGTREEAEQITPQSAYSAYRDMLGHARIEVFAAGCSDFAEAERQITEALSALPRRDIHVLTKAPSALKAQPLTITEKLPMNQAILRMYFKAPQLEDWLAGFFLSMVLGGTATSRFFTNIREKQSLCYYCNSFSNRSLRSMVAYAGVEPQNVELTREAITAEIEDIRKNGVAREELDHALLDAVNLVRASYDSVSDILDWYSAQVLHGSFISPEERIAEMRQITPERIQQAALQYSLDTVYTLCPEEVKR